jgi:hypothetical protein
MRDKMPDVQRDSLALALQKVSLEELGAVMRRHFPLAPATLEPKPKAGACDEEDGEGE